MGRRVMINTEDCMGCEACVELYPEVFEFDEDSEVAVVVMPEGGDEDSIEEAMDSCPAECIMWED